jgi:hypothetical protein
MKLRDSITVEIAAGELMDKISILEIKMERIADAGKLANVRAELDTLLATRNRVLTMTAALGSLAVKLKTANEQLWEIEDEIRDCERRKDFGPRFIELARSVYRTNDQRCAIKRQIDEHLGSRLLEEKSYEEYE